MKYLDLFTCVWPQHVQTFSLSDRELYPRTSILYSIFCAVVLKDGKVLLTVSGGDSAA
jgi:hypothetical protein